MIRRSDSLLGRGPVILVLVLFTLPLAVSAAGYLKLGTIEGEATAVGYANQIEIQAFSFGESRAASGTSGGAAPSPSFTELNLTKPLDRSSPALLVATASGQHFSSATLTLVTDGASPVAYLKIALTDVIVTACQTGGATQSGFPSENISLAYGKIVMTYSYKNSKGAFVPYIGGWDLQQSKPTGLTVSRALEVR